MSGVGDKSYHYDASLLTLQLRRVRLKFGLPVLPGRARRKIRVALKGLIAEVAVRSPASHQPNRRSRFLRSTRNLA